MTWYEQWEYSLKTDEECFIEDNFEQTLINLFTRDFYKRVFEEVEKNILNDLQS